MNDKTERSSSFAEILVVDASAALMRRTIDKTQRSSRELVRAIFAAIEGLTWLYREHVLEVAREVGSISDEQELALMESNFQVTDQGKISKQARFIPLPALIRLTARIASEMNSKLEISFDGLGWNQFKLAIAIRNRVTHPKTKTDMAISEGDLATCMAAFEWLLDATAEAMEAANAALFAHGQEVARLVRELEAGDPHAWAEYRAVAAELNR